MKKWASRKVLKIVIGLIILIFIVLIQTNRNIVPLNMDPIPSIKIKTPNLKDPTNKLVVFTTTAINKSKEAVDVKFHFTKEEDAAEWYTYYDTIPANYVTGIYHIEPEEIKHISSEIVVKTDDDRLVTSSFTNVKVQYEIIK